MTIRAVYIDFGGVLVRTEFQAPRQHLADRLGMTYDDLMRLVFESETARQASLGLIDEQSHWEATLRTLGLPTDRRQALTEAFFGGDVADRRLLAVLRNLRRRYKVGLISNAWSGLRAYITSQGFADAFDEMIISAEVGLVKPDPAIYRLALERLGVRAAEAVFVDDFIENVEAARAVGMYAIHFRDPDEALAALNSALENHR
ncbi:MAG: HAD family phosphatase [Anaerolineales bacterium]